MAAALAACVLVVVPSPIAFAATTLDTATRIQRFIVGEIGSALRVRIRQRPVIGTLIAVIRVGALARCETTDPGSGAIREVGWVL